MVCSSACLQGDLMLHNYSKKLPKPGPEAADSETCKMRQPHTLLASVATPQLAHMFFIQMQAASAQHVVTFAGEDSRGVQQEGTVPEAGSSRGGHPAPHGQGTQSPGSNQEPVCCAALEHFLLSVR